MDLPVPISQSGNFVDDSVDMQGVPTVAASAPTVSAGTLDEPVSQTILRELLAIARKVRLVLFPIAESEIELKNWDLWGPLVFCMALAVVLAISSRTGDARSDVLPSPLFYFASLNHPSLQPHFRWCVRLCLGRCRRRHPKRQVSRWETVVLPNCMRPWILPLSPRGRCHRRSHHSLVLVHSAPDHGRRDGMECMGCACLLRWMCAPGATRPGHVPHLPVLLLHRVACRREPRVITTPDYFQ